MPESHKNYLMTIAPHLNMKWDRVKVLAPKEIFGSLTHGYKLTEYRSMQDVDFQSERWHGIERVIIFRQNQKPIPGWEEDVSDRNQLSI